ncbi:lipopolysaccharide transport periplasmic protein LptA [Acinetobacter larvae]|nr:lipopolysaccharide transport periplasmic protein LptA [Acinetobacter larvae]
MLRQFIFCAATLCSMHSFALDSDRNQPISLVADRATYNDKTGVTTYSGNVVIQQGTLKLQSASIVAQLNKDKQISAVTATGAPAKFQQQQEGKKGLTRGEAQKITYNAESGIITLLGNAYIYQDGASFRGNTLKYSMNKGDIEAAGSSGGGTGNKRIEIIIPPSATKSFPGARD